MCQLACCRHDRINVHTLSCGTSNPFWIPKLCWFSHLKIAWIYFPRGVVTLLSSSSVEVLPAVVDDFHSKKPRIVCLLGRLRKVCTLIRSCLYLFASSQLCPYNCTRAANLCKATYSLMAFSHCSTTCLSRSNLIWNILSLMSGGRSLKRKDGTKYASGTWILQLVRSLASREAVVVDVEQPFEIARSFQDPLLNLLSLQKNVWSATKKWF